MLLYSLNQFLYICCERSITYPRNFCQQGQITAYNSKKKFNHLVYLKRMQGQKRAAFLRCVYVSMRIQNVTCGCTRLKTIQKEQV